MSQFHVLDEKALFEALAEYYNKYTIARETQENRREINSYLDTLLAIMTELNRRKYQPSKSENSSREFNIKRKSDQ